MQKLTYRITTESPVLFAMNVGDTNMVSTRESIPGSVIMGLFANEYIRDKNLNRVAHTDPIFYRWFLTGAVRFTNACIVTQINRNRENEMAIPLPLSLQEEKGNENQVHDLLYADENFDKQTSVVGGFGRMIGTNIYKQPIKKTLNFHHQRDYETGTVKKGMIFNYESIDEHQTFEGNIIGDENELNALLDYFKEEPIVHIGRSRNAQYGRVRFEIISKKPEEFTSEIDGLTSGNGDVSLTLLSNTILYNQHGYPAAEVKVLEKTLQENLGDGVTVKKAFIRTDEVENFVSVWRLRRPAEVCFSAGSCFLLNGIMESRRQILLEMQKNGIGERRGEGFGRIVFGWQSKDKKPLKMNPLEKIRVPEPTIPIPEETKKIIQIITKDLIRKQVEIMALLDAKEFERLPSKSCIGRLEAMVKTMDQTKFLKTLPKLRKPVQDSLERCVNKEETLFYFLKNKVITVREVFSQAGFLQGIKQLCQKINYTPETDAALDAELYRTYFLTFFSSMRKTKNKEGANG